ncbi:MAG: arginine--tRNA ligase [Hyphomicrobiaceae bacterium]
MNVFAEFETLIGGIVEALKADGTLPADLAVSRIAVEPARDPAHGDLQTNVAMVIAKPAGRNPRDLAEAIAARLRGAEGLVSAEVAGAGFINMRLDPAYWPKVVAAVVAAGGDFGRSGLGEGRKVNVEFVSANPTGPLHVGHCRGAVFGDALANLLAFSGHEVTREYYTNDAGAQIEVLARSVLLRYREALGEEIGAIPEGLYPGDYLKPVGEMLARQHGRGLLDMDEAKVLAIVREAAISSMMDLIREDLATLNIHHDLFFSERSLHGSEIAATVADLKTRGLVFEGRLPPPKGQVPEDWEDREQLLFKATEFGDDIDRPLVKSDGTYTYFAADVAYARNKIERGFDQLIYVLGADHGGYVKRLKAVARALSGGRVDLDVKLCQLVKLFKAGEPYKMSKRAGTFVTLRDVVEEVGPDPVRFMMIYRKNDAPLDFDFAKVTEKSRDNPVFYVQYAHARTHSVERNAREVFPDLSLAGEEIRSAPVERLVDESEQQLIRRIAQFPRLVEQASLAHEPHRLAFYLYDLASDFHALWNRGKDLPHLRFIRDDDRPLTTARLALVSALRTVIATGLGILGVHAPEEMR